MIPPFFWLLLSLMLVVWTMAMCFAIDYGHIGRSLRQLNPEKYTEELPPLSVVIAAHNAAPQLRRHLPLMLEQDFDRFEVIVVDMGSTDETKDVLERLEMQYAHLRHTFTPASARDISVERLALTLGFRAARYEWVVITRPDCEPASSGWLTRIAEIIVCPGRSPQSPRLNTAEIVLGFSRYEERSRSWLDLQTGFFRLWNNLTNFQHVLSGHAAVKADACNVAIRKDAFLEHGGFAIGQDLKAGAVELLVNQNSTPRNTALLLSPAATVVQERVSSSSHWKQERVFYVETRRHQRHASLYRWTQFLRMIQPWMILLCLFLPLVVGWVIVSSDDIPQILLLSLLTLLLIIYVVVKTVCFNQTARQLACRQYGVTLFFFELALPFWNLASAIRHRMAARNEFRKKFV
ncbi:MAG: glycosyltransferase [Bacteroidaceae bacterium]|nr:glycosyltransferase [Bacteroidaceae bacterium]